MKHKRFIGIMLIALLMVLALAFTTACGNDDDDEIVLRWMMGGDVPADGPAVWEAVNEELQNHMPGVTLDITVVPFGEYEERWMLEAAAGAEWDLAWFGWMLNLQNEVGMGSLMPLNDLIDSYGQDLLREIPEFMFTNNTIDGNIYLIANNQVAVNTAAGVIIPTELMHHMDVAAFHAAAEEWANSDRVFPPSSFMDVIDDFTQSVYDAGELGLGLSIESFSGALGNRNVWSQQPGGRHTNAAFTRAHDPTSRVYSIFDLEEEEIEFFERIQDWFNRGFIRADGLTVENWDTDFYNFPDGHGYILRVHGYDPFQEGVQSERHGFPVTILPVLYPRASLNTNPTNTAQGIMSGASNPEAAMQFLNLLNSAEGQLIYNMLIHGIQGVHWEFYNESAGVVQSIDGAPDYGMGAWAIGNTYYQFVTPGTDPDQGRYMTRVFNHAAMPMPLGGFVFDTSNLVAESITWGTVMEEYRDVLAMGMVDDVRATIQERNARLETGGIRNYAEQLQQQIDAFNAAR